MERLNLEEMEGLYRMAICFNNESEAMRYNNKIYKEIYRRYKISGEEKRREFLGMMDTLLGFSLKIRESHFRGNKHAIK